MEKGGMPNASTPVHSAFTSTDRTALQKQDLPRL
jgi:hypothetical protein